MSGLETASNPEPHGSYMLHCQHMNATVHLSLEARMSLSLIAVVSLAWAGAHVEVDLASRSLPPLGAGGWKYPPIAHEVKHPSGQSLTVQGPGGCPVARHRLLRSRRPAAPGQGRRRGQHPNLPTGSRQRGRSERLSGTPHNRCRLSRGTPTRQTHRSVRDEPASQAASATRRKAAAASPRILAGAFPVGFFSALREPQGRIAIPYPSLAPHGIA